MSTKITFFVTNIEASPSKPFELFLNGELFYQSSQTISDGQWMNLTADFEGVDLQEEELVVQLKINIPARNIVDREQELNIGVGGPFVMIRTVPSGDDECRLSVRQSPKEFSLTPTALPDQQSKSTSASTTRPSNNAPQATTTTSTSQTRDYIEELEMLANLRDSGILSAAEFEAKKKKLLGL